MDALRHKEIAPTAEEQKFLDDLAKSVGQLSSEKAGDLLLKAQRIGGPPAGKAIVAAFASKDRDVRMLAMLDAAQGLYGRSVVRGLIALLEDDIEKVREEAVLFLGTTANWRYPEAQVALASQASNLKIPENRRVMACETLGWVVKLPLLGNFEDKLPIWTLVQLLNDESLEVRKAAFTGLEKGVPDTFGYKPELPANQRKAAVEKWKAWATQKCGPPPEKK
jgi:HEAT repeat protein